MLRRLVAPALGLLLSTGALAAPGPAVPGLSPSVDGGFRMEPRPAIDDVFGDSAEYRRIVDRFLVLADGMQRTREQFARAVQSVLGEVSAGPGKPRPKHCPEPAVALPYARALDLGQAYLRAGRELARRHEQVREFDRLGETAGLTPDYRVKVKQVLSQYQALLVDYREMKATFHDQLADELHFAGCDPDRLIARAGATAHDEAWPAAAALADESAPAGPDVAPAAPITAGPARSATGEAPPPLAASAPDRSGILFYIDNTRCGSATRVSLDGRSLGDVPASTRAAFQTTPGPHDLCLLPDAASGASARHCGDPGTLRRSYLHEGWTLALRCD